MTEPVVANDRETWRAYWSERGQSWRTEPEIDTGRQEQLTAALEVTADIEQSVFPFKGMRLSRADVEWLLAENVRVAESKNDLSLANADGEAPKAPGTGGRAREGMAKESRNLPRQRCAARQPATGGCLEIAGVDEEADRFAYRAHLIQRRMMLRNGLRSIGPFLFSCFLDVLAGYGYKPGRTLVAYLSTILGFGLLFFLLGQNVEPHFSPLYALLVSIISFHGRGFFPAGYLPTMPMAVVGACEAIIGVTIEISLIATFTQRYFGK